MPQTSYKLQFQAHGGGAVFPSQEPFRVPLPETSLSVKNSTYQQQYPNKSASIQHFDYKELDCAKNKLRYELILLRNI